VALQPAGTLHHFAPAPVSDLFRIEMLPAREGDCLLVAYGDTDHPRRILIDGGRTATYAAIKQRFARLPEEERTFELLIITHVDRDHIEGVLEMLTDRDVPVRFNDIWFNGYDHLLGSELETFGAVQGERLTTALLAQGLPWNQAFRRKAVELRADSPLVSLQGELTLTLLSPDRPKLAALAPQWEEECRKEGLLPGIPAERPSPPPGLERMGGIDIDTLAELSFEADRTLSNGTSIAVLVEYQGRRVLLAADAHPDRLIASVRSLAAVEGRRLVLDAFKLPHHGSQRNISRELVEAVSCPRYLISTNGSYFKHPDEVAVARVIKYGGERPELIFNYRSSETLAWDNPRWQHRHGYQTSYPSPAEDGIVAIEL
jgi:beta-lactamase superfamily II metal-dependent hydrolase